MQKSKTNTFYCFSPLVMAITVIVEVALFIKLVTWRKPTTVNILAMLLLIALATFQAAEYGICEGLFDIHPNVLARVGFVAITALPVLGVHLLSALTKSKQYKVVILAYATMLSWMAVFLFSDALVNQICGGNYVIFEMTQTYGGAFFVYYYFWLIVVMLWSLNIAKKTRKKQLATQLKWYMAGIASFLVPATILWLTWDNGGSGLPSIMCGFAIIFAIILYAKVLPRK